MACEKYSGWIIEATLGQLGAKCHAELHVHMLGCPTCKEEFEGAVALRTLMDRGMESMVSGESSPGFLAGLRARIVEERPAPMPIFASMLIPVAAGALAMAVFFVVRTFQAPHNTGNLAVATFQQETSEPDAFHPPPVGSPVSATRSHTEGSKRSREPEILVPSDQLALAMKFAEGLRAGGVNGEGFIVPQREETPLEVRPLEIPMIEIPPIGSGALDEDGDNPSGDQGGLLNEGEGSGVLVQAGETDSL